MQDFKKIRQKTFVFKTNDMDTDIVEFLGKTSTFTNGKNRFVFTRECDVEKLPVLARSRFDSRIEELKKERNAAELDKNFFFVFGDGQAVTLLRVLGIESQ